MSKANLTKKWALFGSMMLMLSACGDTGDVHVVSDAGSNNRQEFASLPWDEVPAQDKLTCRESVLFVQINLYRQKLGLVPMQVAKAAVAASRFHVTDMVTKKYFAHTEPSGRDAFKRMSDFGFVGMGANAAATRSDDTPFCEWKYSAAHNKNLVNADYKYVGLARDVYSYGYEAVWSAAFGKAESEILAEPLSEDPQCVLPTEAPKC